MKAPAGSLYKPTLIRVIGWTMRRPRSRHQRNTSPLRVGKRKPGPGNSGAAPMRAFRSSLLPHGVSEEAHRRRSARDASAVLDHVRGALPHSFEELRSPVVAVNLEGQRVASVEIFFGSRTD